MVLENFYCESRLLIISNKGGAPWKIIIRARGFAAKTCWR